MTDSSYLVSRGLLSTYTYTNNMDPINPGPYVPRAFGGSIILTEVQHPLTGTLESVYDDRTQDDPVPRALGGTLHAAMLVTTYGFTEQLSASDSLKTNYLRNDSLSVPQGFAGPVATLNGIATTDAGSGTTGVYATPGWRSAEYIPSESNVAADSLLERATYLDSPVKIAQNILVPAYIYPTLPGWTEYINGYPTCAIMIADPSNGPGGSVNSDYTAGIANARAAGLKVVGYVYTNYGARALATVEADIDSWYSLYTIDGIMFDQVQADSTNFSYYQSLYNYVKAKDATRNFVAMNPGVVPAENYTTISDTISVFENTYAGWQSSWSSGPGSTAYLKYHAPAKWWALVYGIPDILTMNQVIQSMKDANVGYIFVTDQVGGNAYTFPPSLDFWSAEQSDANNQWQSGDAQPAGDSATWTNATPTTYSFTEALTAADSLLVTESDIPLDGLSASEGLLSSDGSKYTESNAASDSLGGGGSGVLTDSLSTTDSLLKLDSYLPLDASSISESMFQTETELSLDALTITDLGGSYSWPVDGLTATDSLLGVNVSLPSESVPATDSALLGTIYLPGENLTLLEMLLEKDSYATTDALTVSDLATLASVPSGNTFVDALVASESMRVTNGAAWVEVLPVAQSANIVIVRYLEVAAWVTRDGQVSWVTRDNNAGWTTRDEVVTWKGRD